MKLKELRKAMNMTVAALSKTSGVGIRTIEEIERRKEARVSTAVKLARALNVSMDELCERR